MRDPIDELEREAEQYQADYLQHRTESDELADFLEELAAVEEFRNFVGSKTDLFKNN